MCVRMDLSLKGRSSEHQHWSHSIGRRQHTPQRTFPPSEHVRHICWHHTAYLADAKAGRPVRIRQFWLQRIYVCVYIHVYTHTNMCSSSYNRIGGVLQPIAWGYSDLTILRYILKVTYKDWFLSHCKRRKSNAFWGKQQQCIPSILEKYYQMAIFHNIIPLEL